MKQIPKFSDYIASGKVNEAKSLTREEIIKKFKLTLNQDGSYDAPGDVDLSGMGLSKLPLKFGKIKGDFDCSNNKLTSLKGAPKSIKGDFDCGSNELITLGDFDSESVGGMFDCTHNKLTSLDGKPKSIGGGFYCADNELK